MPWAQEFTLGPCRAVLGWQGFISTPVSALWVSVFLFSSVDGFHLGEWWVGAQHHGHLLLLGAGVKKCSCSHRVEQCGVGSEILIMMCKVSLVLLVHLPASMFHALRHPGWATAEDPNLLHLGKEGAKGVRLQHQFSLQSSPS